ncbi:MAG TPA: hypothetical protein EYH12_06775, partial [Psychromonas hadalis]|nr:hypothetical protein [Psychromonas hadalis]
YPLIRNFDGSISQGLSVITKKTPPLTVVQKVSIFREKLLKHSISVTDLAQSNILCQRLSSDINDFKCILIDGYGVSGIIPIALIPKKVIRNQTARRFDRSLGELLNTKENG